MAEEELAVRSEKSSLEGLSQTLSAIKTTRDTEELAVLLLMITELYGDASCRCEEKEAAYGNGEEAKACYFGVGRSRENILKTYKDIIKGLKGE